MAQRICQVADCERPTLARGWCRLHYQRWWSEHGESCATRLLRGQPEKRFLKFVEKADGCWGWKGTTQRNGYTQITVNNKTVLGHRFSYELHKGPIPDGMRVLHRCDNPSCTNPEHLFLGTNADNMKDMYAKGRGRVAKGEKHVNAIVPDCVARDVVRRHVSDGETQASLVRELKSCGWDLSHSTVSAWCLGKLRREACLRPSM